NRENPDDPTTIEAWTERYPIEIVSERFTDSQPGAWALSQFAGARARTADLARLALAKEAEDSGVAAEQIRLQTGWHRGVDRAWRFELDDSEACLGPQVLQRQQQASAELKAALAALRARADQLRSQVRGGELSAEAAEQAYEEARAPVLVLQDRLQPLLAIAPGAMRGLAAGATRRLDEVLFHPALFAAFPELAALEVRG
ncbi:LPD23 domain-containing protein, partial [Streptomyces sp. G35A]